MDVARATGTMGGELVAAARWQVSMYAARADSVG